MQFQKGYIYHIYNQGNNRQKIFFDRENYLYFLQKMKFYLLPYADILAWCLMPNHFHWMVYVREEEVEVDRFHRLGASSRRTESSKSRRTEYEKQLRTFNNSIGIFLMSYTKAINKQQNRSGKLFREATKAECVNCPQFDVPSFVGNSINIINPEKQYPQICFDYIHFNPVRAGLDKEITDWEFSSARDYYAGRRGRLVNKELAKEYIDI